MRPSTGSAAILFAVGSTCAWVVATGGCSTLADVQPGCSNFVVEPNLGEDCDDATADAPRDTGTARPARCAKIGEIGACHFIADATHDCPIGFHAGPSGGACSRASGAFGAPSPRVTNLLGKSAQVLDLDLDGQLDVVIDGVHDDFTAPVFLERRAGDRYEATVGAREELHTAFVDLSEDGIADVAAPARDTTGLVVRLRHFDRSDEARIYDHTSTAGRLRYAWTPRDDGSGDELLALFEDADGASCGGGVCGCVVGRADCPAPFAVPWLAPDALPGLRAVHGRSGAVLAPSAGPLEFVSSAAEAAAKSWISLPSADYAGGITLRDLDGDGAEDAGFLECGTEVRFARARGPFTIGVTPAVESVATKTQSTCFDANGPAFGFFDDDALADLAYLDDVWTSSAGPTTGALPAAAKLLPFLGTNDVTALDVGDVNGDGRDDLVLAYRKVSSSTPPPSTTVMIALGAEGLSFPAQTYPTPAPIKQLAIVDVDGDGLGDVVAVVGAETTAGDDCATLDDVLVAYGRASGYPEPWQLAGRFPRVERITAGRWTADAYDDIALASHCADVPPAGRGAILRGDPGRRPFSVLHVSTAAGAPADVLRALAAPDLTPALGLSSGIVVTAIGADKRATFLLPFTGRAEPQLTERIELPLPSPAKKTGQTLLQAILSRPEAPGAFIGAGLDVYEPSRVTVLYAGQAGGEVTDQLVVRPISQASNADWSLASLPPTALDTQRRYAVVTRDVNDPEFASALGLFHVDDEGHFADVVDVPVLDRGPFVGVTVYEGEAGEHVLLVATENGVDQVDPTSGALSPFLVGGAPLDVTGVTAIASGDFSGDGLDDVLVIDENGGVIVPQLAKTPAQP